MFLPFFVLLFLFLFGCTYHGCAPGISWLQGIRDGFYHSSLVPFHRVLVLRLLFFTCLPSSIHFFRFHAVFLHGREIRERDECEDIMIIASRSSYLHIYGRIKVC